MTEKERAKEIISASVTLPYFGAYLFLPSAAAAASVSAVGRRPAKTKNGKKEFSLFPSLEKKRQREKKIERQIKKPKFQ